MSALAWLDPQLLPVAISFSGFGEIEFWIQVGVLAGTYTLFTLGLQLNVGYTGIINFGQAGFMAIGAYSMGILVVEAGWSIWVAFPTAILIAMLFGLLIGLPSLRLRADYFAIATIAAAEIVRLWAQNSRGLTGGNQGLIGYDTTYYQDVAIPFNDFLADLGWTDAPSYAPLLFFIWAVVLLAVLLLVFLQRSPWGRVLRAVREDEDAARALGKNAFSYKLQSLALSAALAATAGFALALNLSQLHPTSFEPLVTFIGYGVLVLGGLANYWGVAVGAIIMWTVLEGTRVIDLGISDDQAAALRFIIVGLVLILLMAFRPQGMFGKREEMVLGD